MTCYALAIHSLINQILDEPDNYVQNVPEKVPDSNTTSGVPEECFVSYEKQLKELSHMFKNIMKVLETTQALQARTSQPQLASHHNNNCHESDNNHDENDSMVPQQIT